MQGMNLDKTQVARRQLGTALALFIDDLDPVSVHTLACAGGEIAEHLTRKAGATPFVTHAMSVVPDLTINKIRLLQNQFWNSFKHATTHKGEERADQELLMRFNDSQNDHTLFVGWYDYVLATGTMTPEGQAFQVWYFALYPEKLNPEFDGSSFDLIFPGLRKCSRAEQKARLRDAIKKTRNDSAIMSDTRTDKSELCLRD